MVVMLAATLSGCRLAKKDEDGTVKKTLYGAYAVVGKSLDDPDIPDPEMEGTTVGQKDKKGFVHFKKIKGYFFFHKYDQKENIKEQMVHFIWNLQEGLLCRNYVKQEGLGSANLFLWIQKKER